MAARVLMLGWEFPPFITGGLGTACHGLTRALSAAGADVTFVLPRSVDPSASSHVHLLSPEAEASETLAAGVPAAPASVTPGPAPAGPSSAVTIVSPTGGQSAAWHAAAGSHAPEPVHSAAQLAQGTPARLSFLGLGASASAWPSAYATSPVALGMPRSTTQLESWRRALGRLQRVIAASSDPVAYQTWYDSLSDEERAIVGALPEASASGASEGSHDDGAAPAAGANPYDGDLVLASERYARFCVRASRGLAFDVIHAHDWITYPAGIALARLTGRPLVVHVHATEFDRSGDHVNQAVYNIERRGMHAAVRVICVSMLTRNLCVNRYGVPPEKVDVIYNGVDVEPSTYGIKRIERNEKIVLYFGRITMQKGPEYFVRAAKRVLDVMPEVRFIVAGNGDQATRMIEMAAEMGIGSRMTFTGFLRGRDIPRVFSMADVYVMPSVSEPFGIAPLEAMGHRVPVIISRNSGVSEILTHALKVDFWDVDDIASKIVAVLRYPPLRNSLRDHGLFEVRGITWDGAARRCLATYAKAIAAVSRH
jgi:glycosyltransferase involved in cell wall biosynthesis